MGAEIADGAELYVIPESISPRSPRSPRMFSHSQRTRANAEGRPTVSNARAGSSAEIAADAELNFNRRDLEIPAVSADVYRSATIARESRRCAPAALNAQGDKSAAESGQTRTQMSFPHPPRSPRMITGTRKDARVRKPVCVSSADDGIAAESAELNSNSGNRESLCLRVLRGCFAIAKDTRGRGPKRNSAFSAISADVFVLPKTRANPRRMISGTPKGTRERRRGCAPLHRMPKAGAPRSAELNFSSGI
jgi:hypothetical protein